MSIFNGATFAGWARRLRRSWIALGILALSMTAAFVMLNVVDAVLVRALPYPDSSALVAITRLNKNRMKVVPDMSYGRWASLINDDALFSAYQTSNMIQSTATGMARVRVARVTPSLFEVLGMRVSAGRPLSPVDTAYSPATVAVIVAEGDEVGRHIVLDGHEYEVVGALSDQIVLPNGTKPAVILPLAVSSAPAEGRPVRFINQIVARLRPGVSIAALTARLAAVDAGVREELPAPMQGMWEGSTLSITSLQDEATRGLRRPILMLQTAAAALLLIAALNVAALQMVMILGRQTEVGTRISLGASSLQIAAGLVIESTGAVVISGLVAVIFTSLLLRVLPSMLAWEQAAKAMPGWGAAAVLGAGVTVLLVSVVCAATSVSVLRLIYRRNPYGAWRRVSAGLDARRLYGILVAGQIAVAIVLLAGALLLLRAYGVATRVEWGFSPDGVVSTNISLHGAEFDNPATLNAVMQDVLQALRRSGDVSDAAVASTSPGLMPSSLASVALKEPAGLPAVEAGLDQVSPEYFTVCRIPLLKGHVFGSGEAATGAKVAVISDALARQLFGNREPLGNQVAVGDQIVTVVGVVGNVHRYSADQAPAARVYGWFAQQPASNGVITMRTTHSRGTGVGWIEPTVKSATARAVTYGADTLDHSLAVLTAPEQLRAAVALALGLIAVFIACAGVYGLASYYALTRRRDVAIRVAVGASPGMILRLQLFDGIKLGLMACGLALPIVAAVYVWMRPWLAASGSIEAVPLTWLGIGIMTAILLAFLPAAYRTSRSNPVRVLSEQ